MATTTFYVKHRPLRIGFLVRPNDLSDLEKAAGICTLLWGGIRNAIIPVASPTDETAGQLLKLFQIDVIHAIGESEEIKRFCERYQFLHSEMGSKDLFAEHWPSGRMKVAYLDTLNAIEKYWENEFKHADVGHESTCKLVRWNDNDPLKTMFAISYGAYPTDLNLKDDFHNGFLQGLRGQEVLIGENGPIYPPLARCLTPMLLTGIDLDGYGHSVRSWDGAYFGDGRNFSDLVTFWNLRAAGNNIVFAPLAELPRCEEFIKVHFGHLDQEPDRHPNIPDHIHFSFNRSFVNSHDRINEITKLFPTKKQHAVNFCDDVNRNGLNVEPAMFHFMSENAPALIEREGDGYNVTITLPPKSFLSKSERYVGNQQMAFSLAAVGSFAHPDHTLSPPFRPELNEFYSRQMSFDPWKIRSEKEGIGALGVVDEKILSLKPIRETEVIKALLGLAGVKVKPSQGGRLADRLIEKLDGLNGSRIFKIRGVRNLIARLNSQTAIDRGQATKEIWNDGQLKEGGGLYIKGQKCEDSNVVFDMLLQHEFFRAGLELKCDHCGLENWLSLRLIDDIWVCEYCGHRNTTSLHIKSRGDWKFRKSGLLAKDNNQEGAIPVLLSLLVFERILRREKILHMTSVNIEGKAPCEIDFMAVSYSDDRHEYKMEWALGEAKSEGGIIDLNDANNMKGVANKIKDIGIKPYLIFTKTADSFNADEIALFKTLHKEGHSLILLTNKEMEANFVTYGERKNGEKLPKQFAHTFGDMALNSEYRYLRENPPSTPAAVTPVAPGP